MTEIQIAGKSYQPAAFSLINSLLIMFGAEVSFVIGLGATQVVDAVVAVMREEVAASSAAVLSAVGLAINLCLIGVVMAIWWACGRGSTAAYVVGMVLYGFDGLLFVLVGDWIGVGFHVFFLFMLWGGYRFMREWRNAETFLARPAAGPPPETYVAPTT
jgi:hypothetical protein